MSNVLVYLLQNPTGKFYIGQTEDLPARLDSHNRTDKTLGKFTRKNGPWLSSFILRGLFQRLNPDNMQQADEIDPLFLVLAPSGRCDER
jgi:hypothetical protein